MAYLHTAHAGDMAEETQTQAQRTTNLARIRDNQRRSRARRKEYLQELEGKYRTCEQVGIEASAEIQAAARRVVDENKRLRHILRQRGVSDADIDNLAADEQDGPTAASELEGLLGQCRPCGQGSECGHGSDRTLSRTPPVASASRPSPSPPVQQVQQPMITPRPGAANPVYTSPLTTMPSNAHFPTPQLPSYPTASPAIHPSMAYGVNYNEPFEWQNQFQTPTQVPDVSQTTSCYVAADAIRSIKPELGYELEHELGCGNGMECNVANTTIFNLMDRHMNPGT